MVFSSFVFLWVFLPVTLMLYYVAKSTAWRNFLLFAVSLLFYAWGEPLYVVLMIASTTFNYFVGIAVEKWRRSAWGGRALSFGVIINLLVLGYYKYLNFLVENLNQFLNIDLRVPEVVLPIGISFYTFHCISYIVDVYRSESGAQRNFLKMGLYISFFPQLVAGPIVKYRDIYKQLDSRCHTLKKFNYGVMRFAVGMAKKVLIANILGKMADGCFDGGIEVSSVMGAIGIFSYTLQIYFDFSGYSDMAIGLAQMFGFRFKENFRTPYSSVSIKEFWRRWHISLSTWFRDYLYIPLGGNRAGGARVYFNLIIVFFATGLWHGASWNFIFWGLWHGVFLILERSVNIDKLFSGKILGRLYVMSVVAVGWVFFRANDFAHGVSYLRSIFSMTGLTPHEIVTVLNVEFLGASILALMLSGLFSFRMVQLNRLRVFWVGRASRALYYSLVPLIVILYLAGNTHNPFIYFRF